MDPLEIISEGMELAGKGQLPEAHAALSAGIAKLDESNPRHRPVLGVARTRLAAICNDMDRMAEAADHAEWVLRNTSPNIPDLNDSTTQMMLQAILDRAGRTTMAEPEPPPASSPQGQISTLFLSAIDAETAGAWPELRKICEQALATNGLKPDMEALFRRLHARALVPLAIGGKRADTYDINLLQKAIEDARKALALFSQPDSRPDPAIMRAAHEVYGSALYAFALTPDGLKQRTELLEQTIAEYEKALQIEPENSRIHKVLNQARNTLNAIRQPPQKQEEKKSGCYIATAAYGSPLAPEVMLLRRFRDEVLLKSKVGKGCISFYYTISPPMASFISKTAVLRAATRQFLIKPVLWVLKATSKFQ